MGNGIYVHPWDIDDRTAQRLAILGFGDVAVAAAYHAGRWLTPRGAGMVRFLEDGVVHFRPSEQALRGALVPLASSDVPEQGPSPLERVAAAGRDSGLDVHAWTVLFHNSRLGRQHPDSCVRNALGEPYTYALCPARPEVRAYGLALVGDLGRHALHGIELEAAGFMGHRHGSHHDKSSFAFSPYVDFLLSYCFCDACRAGLDAVAAPGGGDALRRRAAELLRARIDGGDVLERPDPERDRQALVDDLGERSLAAMLEHREKVCASLLAEVRAAVPDTLRVALHLQPDPLFTGSQMGIRLDAVTEHVDEVIFTHYGEDPAAIERAWATGDRRAEGVATRLAFWPRSPQISGEDDVRAVARVAAQGGCDGVRVYHLGLLPDRTLERVAAALA